MQSKFSKINLTVFLTLLVFTKQILAICPICTIAIGVGVGLAEYLGIDNSISGLWIGGFTVSLILWTINWFEKKKVSFPGRSLATTIVYYFIIVFPLYYPMGLIGHPSDKLLGIDKLVLGIIIGSVVLLLNSAIYSYIKAKRGKPHFPFQKVVMPIASLFILSFVLYFVTR